MDADAGSKRWWQTLPGIITAVAAIITALTGLIVAINQTGWFTPRSEPTVPRASQPGPSAPVSPSSPAGSQPSPAASTSHHSYSLALPSIREYQLGQVTFTLLEADVSPRTSEGNTVRIRLRMLNHQRYDANFWDQSFRLVLDGVPLAPVGGLNVLVPGQSAKEGVVLFVVPHGTTAATLVITYADDSTNIPMDLRKAT